MQFSYRLIGTGWGRARLVDGDNSIELTASYLSDPLGGVLSALSAIQEGAESAQCTWYEEPGECRWLFTRRGDWLQLKVLSSVALDSEQNADGEEVVFECEAPSPEMEEVFASAMHQVLDQWGENGYLAEWVEHPFPTELLERVESRIVTQ